MQIIFAIGVIILATLFVTFLCRTRNHPADGVSGRQRGLGGIDTRRKRLADVLVRYPAQHQNGRYSTASSSPTPARWASSARSAWYRDDIAAAKLTPSRLLVEIFYNEYHNFTLPHSRSSGVLALLSLATLAVQNIVTKLQDKKLAAAERNAV